MQWQHMPVSRQRKKGRRQTARRLYVGWALALCSFVVLMSACSKYHTSKSGGGQPGDTTPSVALTHTSPTVPANQPASPTRPVITLQVNGCPAGIPVNWDSLVGAQPNVNKVQTVTCANLVGALSALVSVRYYSPDAKLDVYVYDNLYGTPAQRFSLKGLLNGDAQISPTNTIMTAEVGPGDEIKGARDVFKEYQWSAATASFQQILFPGIFPDTTHYQAEQSQAKLNAGLAAGDKQDAWRTEFLGVVGMLAKKLFHWTNFTTGTVSYQTSSASYVASVTNDGVGGGGFIATMMHLDTNVDTSVFEITKVTSLNGTVVLSTPTTGLQVNNPVSVQGNCAVRGSILGHIVLYNDIFFTIGDSGAIPSGTAAGSVNFNKTVTYRLNGHGLQEGIVAFFSTNQNSIAISDEVVMVKVFFSA